MRDTPKPPLDCHITVDQPTPAVSQVVDVVTITSHLHKLTLMDDLINRHSELKPLCQQTAALSLFTDFMIVCRELKLYTTNTE